MRPYAMSAARRAAIIVRRRHYEEASISLGLRFSACDAMLCGALIRRGSTLSQSSSFAEFVGRTGDKYQITSTVLRRETPPRRIWD